MVCGWGWGCGHIGLGMCVGSRRNKYWYQVSQEEGEKLLTVVCDNFIFMHGIKVVKNDYFSAHCQILACWIWINMG